MMKTPLLLFLVIWGGVWVAQLSAAVETKPNILFIAVDDLRPEMGCYGNPVVKTPNLDRIAARGVVFDRAYCQQAVCSPSRTSLMTGRRPDATRVWDLETHFRVALPDAITLPQHFKANGYYCAALGKIYHRHFEDEPSWNEPHWYPSVKPAGGDAARPAGGAAKKAGGGGPKGKGPKGDAFEASPSADDELADGMTAAEAVRRLQALKSRGQPFFLAVGFLKPHLPFVAPKKYWDLYDPEKIPRPAIDQLPEGAPPFAGHDNGELHSYANCPKDNPVPEDFAKQLRHGYYACASFTDAQVGRLLDALDQEGLAGNTIVVVWGDHGWQLGDHGLWHKHTNFELATRAPLLISVPGMKTAGKKCSATVEFVDIYPTLAEVCGLAVPAGLDGASLKPFLENPAAPAAKPAISQYPRGGTAAGGAQLMGYSIRDERWRLTVWRDRSDGGTAATELYDEQSDPAESKNVASAHPEVVERMGKFLPPLPEYGGGKGGKAPKPKAHPDQDRDAMFTRKDTNNDGKLTFEEFIANQPGPGGARERFQQWDAGGKGFLTREEFTHTTGSQK